MAYDASDRSAGEGASTLDTNGNQTTLAGRPPSYEIHRWLGAYRRLSHLGYDHRPRTQRPGRVAVNDPDEILPRVHRVISNLKTWLQGTYRGVSKGVIRRVCSGRPYGR